MNDNDVKGGLGNQQDYGFRIYDPRIGKFLSVDPLTKDYPWYTPYQFAGNTPIQAIDLDGMEPSYVYKDGKGQLRQTPDGDNLARKNIPSGHQQYLRNSFSLPNEQQLKEQWANSLNFVPIIGQYKSYTEGATGEEWFTGRKLSPYERKLAIFLPMKFGGVAAQEVKGEIRALASEEGAIIRSGEKATLAHSGNVQVAELNKATQVLSKTEVRKAYARKIFTESGKSESEVRNLMNTIEFSKQVRPITLNAGDKVYRFERYKNRNTDMHFFTDAYGADGGPTAVGFGEATGYKLITYEVTKPTEVLESTIRYTKTKQYFSIELQNNIKKIAEE